MTNARDAAKAIGIGTEETARVFRAIEARDAEHRAELAAAQRTIEQLGKDGAAIAEKLDRAVGFVKRFLWFDEGCKRTVITRKEAKEFLASPAAPPPAESTPVQATPPDDIRARLEGRLRWHDQQFAALDRRLAALEAKGEPGTHEFVPGPWLYRELCWAPTGEPNDVCGHAETDPVHPKGAKP